MIIAIDGPSGAGKSTLGKMIAEKLNLLYLDTGAMYRAVALAVLLEEVSARDHEEITEIARDSEIELLGKPNRLRVKLNGENVTDELRTNEVSQIASIVSTIPEVREELVERQREMGKASKSGAILDGRDIGTVVFPEAEVKFFLTATPEARAKRRFEEDSARGIKTKLEKTLGEIIRRDERDANRKHSPLQKADDAIEIDTSEMSEEQVFEKMLEEIEKKTS